MHNYHIVIFKAYHFNKYLMSEVENFIFKYEGNQKEIMIFLHDWLTVNLNLIGKLRFKIPFYYGKSWICYINPKKNDIIEFAFVRGNELSNEQGILDNKGRKQVYSIEFKNIQEIPKTLLNEIIQEAILLDETKPYESKKRRI